MKDAYRGTARAWALRLGRGASLRKRTFALALALALVLGAARPAAAWFRVSDTLVCRIGHPHCVDRVIDDMRFRYWQLARRCDHDAIFSLLYLRTTQKFQETLGALDYQHPASVVREDALFASYYFRAFHAYHRGFGAVHEAWQIAFDAAAQHAVSSLGNALLGMNAHIQRDLPFTLFELDQRGQAITHADHDLVNVFLAQVDVAAEVKQRFDPTFETGDPAVVQQIIVAWREQAFANYLRLRAAATDAERAAVAAEIEAAAAAFARVVMVQTGYTSEADRAARDAYCR